MSGKIIFIIGGARSGKSKFALEEASRIPGKKAYIATAEALDEEMRERIEEHKEKRGDDWDTYEEPLRISEVIRKINSEYKVIIIDCLTLWISNLMHDKCDSYKEIENLINTLENTRHPTADTELLFIVSNEVGMGIVPENELARKFRDMVGVINQKISELADEVYLVTAGIPIKIKS